LRPIPGQVGPVRLSAQYTSASSEAQVGGDLYAAVGTAEGLGLILGDAEGKGLPAVHMAADVMFAFRVAAREEDKLSAVAARIEAALEHELGDEQFITAVIAEVSRDCRELAVLNCGHPQPIRLSLEGPQLLGPADNGLPLGLGPLAAGQRVPFIIPWEVGDPVLFYTDGLIEARDEAGTFFLVDESEAFRGHANPETLVERLSAEVNSYVSNQQHDDMAMLLIWRHESGAAGDEPTSRAAKVEAPGERVSA
jgi:serine phosphatase RsbU (regulator of sigma subunit)